VRVIWAILPGEVDRNFSKAFVFDGLLRFAPRARRFAMSPLIDGRVTLSRSAVCAVSELMLVSEAPMALRSAERPEMNRWSWSISSLKAASWASTVPRTALRLVMVRPMTSSRSARVEVSDAVLASSELTLPPSPCRTLMISPDSSLTSLGDSAANSGLNPLNSTVRSSADWVWSSPMVAPSLSGAAPPTSCVRAM
jgi:hypothetical protein